MAKAKGDRNPITLMCGECRRHAYHTTKSRRNDPERLELRKYCPVCRRHRQFRERR